MGDESDASSEKVLVWFADLAMYINQISEVLNTESKLIASSCANRCMVWTACARRTLRVPKLLRLLREHDTVIVYHHISISCSKLTIAKNESDNQDVFSRLPRSNTY